MKDTNIVKTLNEANKTDFGFDKWTLAMILVMVAVFGAVFGFIYEEIFYRIDLGYFTKRGTTFGPWIPIYAYGAIFITLMAYRFRKNPVVVFLLSCIVSGILEFTIGYLLFHISGTRLWDYNVEIWNWGNIGGYICARSVLFFGISGLFLVYVVIPAFKIFASKCSKKTLTLVALIPGTLFVIDMVVNTFLGGLL